MDDPASESDKDDAHGKVEHQAGAPEEIERIDVRNEADWLEPPKVTFGERASLEIAKWVLAIFAGVYVLCFVLGILMFACGTVKPEDCLQLTKSMIESVLPIVTLAVGYYLGDRRAQQS